MPLETAIFAAVSATLWLASLAQRDFRVTPGFPYS
jgi:hypothetical protein